MTELADFDKIKCQFEKETIEPGYYTLHRPSKCNLKFPKSNRPIHKKITDPYEGKTLIKVPQNDIEKQMIVRSGETLTYPAICNEKKYKDIVKKAFIETTIPKKLDYDELRHQAEMRKKKFKELQKPQPKLSKDHEEHMQDDQTETLNRAEALRDEELQGARIANQIILASKCHAIRDAQVVEKSVIAKELESENKRLDRVMEEARVQQLNIEQKNYERRKKLKKENIDALKHQIARIEHVKKEELVRKQRESDLINRTEAAAQAEELRKQEEKREKAKQLKELLDKCNKELSRSKMKAIQEERQMEERIRVFVQQRREREDALRAHAEKKKATRAEGIDNIAKIQKAQDDLREELANLRMMKAEEEVERQYREKEKAALKKKWEAMKKLQEAREKQIADIKKQMAIEVSLDEEVHKKVTSKIEEDTVKEEKKTKMKRDAIEKYKNSIMMQIKEKELKRNEEKNVYATEGRRVLERLQEEENREKQVVKRKVAELCKQNVPIKYIKEAELQLSKLKYL